VGAYSEGQPVETPTVGPYYGLRLMGMGGAFTAVAEGIEGVPYTLTALANRRPNQGGWFDWDATLTWVVPANILDIDYNGCPTRGSLTLIAFGGLLRFGRLAVGTFIDQITFPQATGRVDSLSVIRSSTGAAYAFPGDAWVVGFGLHTTAYELVDRAQGATALALGLGANLLYRPPGKRYRLGATFRMPQAARIRTETQAQSSNTPQAIVDPWQLSLGGSFWIGEGELNQPIPVRDSEPGRPVAIAGMLMAADLVLLIPRGFKGIAPVGLEAYFEGRAQAVNLRPTLALRLGAETQPVADRVRLRGGLIVEPSRFSGIPPRVHLTGGLDVRLFTLYGAQFRGSLAFDLAAGYSISSLSLGLW